MADHITAIQGLQAANKAMTPRTPYLEVALGGLVTAQANAEQHVIELGRQAAERAKALATLEAARTAIVQEEAAVAGTN